LQHDVRSIAREASVAPATTFKRANRPFEVLELDLSGFPTNQELARRCQYGILMIV
jgi:hypothetical protein